MHALRHAQPKLISQMAGPSALPMMGGAGSSLSAATDERDP
jgi:hypothetical protein